MRVGAGLRGAVVGIWLLLVSEALAQMGPAISQDKKLLVYGVNAVEAPYLRKHIATMEEWFPVDGIMVSVYPDDWEYRRTGQEGTYFGGHQYNREDFTQTLAEMKAIKFERYTDNFIVLETCARGARYAGAEYGNMDWFDPNWSVIAENGAVIAWLAKEAGFKGILFDVEGYPGDPGPWKFPFDYTVRPDKDKRKFGEVAAQVRKRGREWMEAVTAVYPDISIIIIQNTGWSHPGEERGLVPRFVDGMLEGAGPDVSLSDGGEYGYWSFSHNEFKELVEAGRREGARMSRVPEIFKERIRHDVAIALDEDRNRPRGIEGGFGWRTFYTKPGELNKNWRSPESLENTLYQALTATDRYVWIYVVHSPHFLLPGPPHPQGINLPWDICPQCPHGDYKEGIPQAYRDALVNCKKPHDLSWNKFKSPEYLADLSASFGPGDVTVEERFKARMIKKFDPDGVSMSIPGGRPPKETAVYVDPGASLTDEGVKVTGNRGVEYDARALLFNWVERYDYEMTIEFWHKYENGGRLLTVGRYDKNPTPLYQVIYIATDEKGVKVCVYRGGDGEVARSDYAFERDKWYHFALVYDPNVSNPYGTKTDGITRLYINGKEVIAAQIKVTINPDWADDAVIRVGGSTDDDAGVSAGPGKGVYADLVITRGLKYREKFTPSPMSSNE